jgi:DNA-directed RNA polymerase subunit RPC12/RpoP
VAITTTLSPSRSEHSGTVRAQSDPDARADPAAARRVEAALRRSEIAGREPYEQRAHPGSLHTVDVFSKRDKGTSDGAKRARMVFAECAGCGARIRVWDISRGVAPSGRAATARLTAVSDADRGWRCPQCGSRRTLPRGGVYVVYDRKKREVRYVGRSVDVQRRLDWWERPESPYADHSRYRGVQLVTSGVYPDVGWFGAREAEG